MCDGFITSFSWDRFSGQKVKEIIYHWQNFQDAITVYANCSMANTRMKLY